MGALAAVVALYLRRSLEETASQETMRHKEAGSILGLLHHKRAFLIVLAFTAGGSLYFYTFTTYMQKYLVNTVKMDPKTVSTVMTVALVLYMLLQPVFGALSDRIGRRNNMLLFTGLATFAAVPILTALGSAASATAAFGLIMAGPVVPAFFSPHHGGVEG